MSPSSCDPTPLMLYAIDALTEDEVVDLARHLPHCPTCRNRLTDRRQLREAVLARQAASGRSETDRRAA